MMLALLVKKITLIYFKMEKFLRDIQDGLLHKIISNGNPAKFLVMILILNNF